jgi:hypothetical protein
MTVKERMIEREQEPYIADKMKEYMESNNFQVVQSIKKDSYPGKFSIRALVYYSLEKLIITLGRPDHLNREFLWDLRSIFKSGQPFLAEHLEISAEDYPAFLDKLVNECTKQPESKWSMVSNLCRKPLE